MGEVGYEGRSLVTDHFFWKSMMAPDMFQEQLGDSGRDQGGDCGYGMNPFRQVIHHHEGGIVPLGVWEFSYHVYEDHLPVLVRDGQGPCWGSASPPSVSGRFLSSCMCCILR